MAHFQMLLTAILHGFFAEAISSIATKVEMAKFFQCKCERFFPYDLYIYIYFAIWISKSRVFRH